MMREISHDAHRQHREFFHTFGYTVYPQLLLDDIEGIREAFEETFTQEGIAHDPQKRSCLFPCIERNARLCSLFDFPSLQEAITQVLGPFNYLGSIGNYFTGDTFWHIDGPHQPGVGAYLKVAIYLEAIDGSSGALRVIPGSHHPEMMRALSCVREAKERWGVPQRELPAVVLASQPGDVILFEHRLLHASFGGGKQRGMIALNCCSLCETEAEHSELRSYVTSHARFWQDRIFSDTFLSHPERLDAVRQVQPYEALLPNLVARARREMNAPAWR